MDETKLTAALPTMTIDVIRRDLGERGEQVAVQITAKPGFDAWERLLAGQGPMAWFAPWTAMNPFLAINPFAHLWLGPGPKALPAADLDRVEAEAGKPGQD